MLICGLIIIGLLLSVTSAGALADSSITPTPQNNTTATPTATPVPTPVPTPAPRQVLSNVGWDNDHAYVTVTNDGPAIQVVSYIGAQSNQSTTTVPAGATTRVPTMSIVGAQASQVYRCTFQAYENGTLIDSMSEVPVTVTTGSATPTPPPATSSISGIVVDESSNPVAGAQMTFESVTWGNKYTAVTDSTGQYSASGMVPDIYKITITATGYQTFQSMTENAIGNVQEMGPITIQKLPAGATPTPTPQPVGTPTPTPGFIDAWISLLETPTACVTTLAVLLGAAVSATAIYEWVLKQRERRRKEAEQQGGENKDTKESK